MSSEGFVRPVRAANPRMQMCWQTWTMRRWTALALCVFAACGGEDDAFGRFAPATTAPATTATTSTPTTTTTTTIAPTTPSTLAPPTTRPPLPVPISPPVEDGSTDPVVVLGQIDIPRLGLNRTMYEGIRLSTFDLGPGHWPGTAMPGEIGNAVVAGHRVSGNQDFRDIDQLTSGDQVIFTTDTGRHDYRVKSTEIVTPDALRVVDQSYAKTATLFACHPPGSVAQRIVVHLELA
jgi:sortase A